jgi:2,4-dienoyl-CoA reductase-like NADH-dependent reductase (Old Yellow Enzyme family)
MNSQLQSGGFRRLFEPLEIGDFTVCNRIVLTTHGTGLGETRDLCYLQERARGGGECTGTPWVPDSARQLLTGMAKASRRCHMTSRWPVTVWAATRPSPAVIR